MLIPWQSHNKYKIDQNPPQHYLHQKKKKIILWNPRNVSKCLTMSENNIQVYQVSASFEMSKMLSHLQKASVKWVSSRINTSAAVEWEICRFVSGPDFGACVCVSLRGGMPFSIWYYVFWCGCGWMFFFFLFLRVCLVFFSLMFCFCFFLLILWIKWTKLSVHLYMYICIFEYRYIHT